MNNSKKIDASHTAIIIQGLQNDVMSPQGKLYNKDLQAVMADLGVTENIGRIADIIRERSGTVTHLPFVVYPGGIGIPDTAPVFRRFATSEALIHGSWGAEPWEDMLPAGSDFVIEKMRVNPFHGSTLLPLLRSLRIQTVIPVGTQTNMGIVAAARAAADEGFEVIAVVDASAANEVECHHATFDYALSNVATVMDTESLLKALS